MTAASQTASYRIQKDLKEVMSCSWVDAPPMLVHPIDDRVNHVAALVMGPPDTPYHGGFFTFELRFPASYPNEPPTVKFLSTCDGTVRLNPNLYADGKVCLSILGTWRGEAAEVWRSSYSLLYVLNAAQCLILNGEPYHNEPGFEKEKAATGIVFEQMVPQVGTSGTPPSPPPPAVSGFTGGKNSVSPHAPSATATPPTTPGPSGGNGFGSGGSGMMTPPGSTSSLAGHEALPASPPQTMLTPLQPPMPIDAPGTSDYGVSAFGTAPPPLAEQQQQQQGTGAPASSFATSLAGPALAPPPPPPPAPAAPAKMRRLVITAEQIAADKAHYNAKITHEVTRVAVCDVLDVLLGLPSIPVSSPRRVDTDRFNATTSSPPQTPGVTPTFGNEGYGTAEAPAFPSGSPPSGASGFGGYFGGSSPPANAGWSAIPNPHTPSRAAMLGTQCGLFAREIRRQFLARFETYVEQINKPELLDLDDSRFRRLTFEYQTNSCDGFFAFKWLLTRLHNIRAALVAETDAWKAKGRELTSRMAYVASVLQEEAGCISTECPGVSGGIVDRSNVFVWELSFVALEGVYEEAIYTVEVVFCDDAPPRVQFKQPIWHPNISPSGVPMYFLTEPTVALEKRYTPLFVVNGLLKLLNRPPMASPSSWVNTAAAKQYFSSNAEDVKAFKTMARRLSRKTNE